MMPIAPLMIEHRLIERIIPLIKDELDKIKKQGKVDILFIDTAVDFFRTYADGCHHGKEEDIFFRDLATKQLGDEHKKIMNELVEEHVFARKTVGNLVNANKRYAQGDTAAADDIIALLKALVELYPKHIEKEDQHFFIPCMKYFSKQEKDELLKEFWEFDRTLIHERYKKIIEQLESSTK